VVERGGLDEADLGGSDTIVSQGFEWYGHQFERRTRRGRIEEDRAMRYGGSKGDAEKLLGRCLKNKEKNNKGDS
jgi:hypothetical protein